MDQNEIATLLEEGLTAYAELGAVRHAEARLLADHGQWAPAAGTPRYEEWRGLVGGCAGPAVRAKEAHEKLMEAYALAKADNPHRQRVLAEHSALREAVGPVGFWRSLPELSEVKNHDGSGRLCLVGGDYAIGRRRTDYVHYPTPEGLEPLYEALSQLGEAERRAYGPPPAL